LVGIQPKSIEWGMSPTPPVEAALALACDETVKLMKIWEDEQQQSTRGLPESGTNAIIDLASRVVP